MFGIKWLESKEQKWNDFEDEALPHLTDLFRIAMWLTRDRDLAEDLVQETMMQALKSFHRYERGTNCRAWLATVMHNLNLKRIHKEGRVKYVDDAEDKLAETVPFEAQIPKHLTDDEVIGALRDLPENFRSVIVLSDVEEFSYKEISAILEIPMGTVMSRLYRGRKIMRTSLAHYAGHYGFGDAEKVA